LAVWTLSSLPVVVRDSNQTQESTCYYCRRWRSMKWGCTALDFRTSSPP
jgi:hypothetical protein